MCLISSLFIFLNCPRMRLSDLKDFMRQAGEVTYADAHKRERNMGIVDFATYSDMKNALEKLDGADLHGRRIRLVEDKSRRRGKQLTFGISGAAEADHDHVPDLVLDLEEAVSLEVAASRDHARVRSHDPDQSPVQNLRNATTKTRANHDPEVVANRRIIRSHQDRDPEIQKRVIHNFVVRTIH
ncbi:serine/arginine-rich splicing factor 4-like protein [Leptotrombidium deliense]|uniref:Serine/arginine-rich splicing factor 4-like protein n=1 Tax=Leptotrombidium deliense TaxID=299467 RepID=A0A443SPU6_9ACAR|nr:serine/arginine-rich splicing factor 4-like protein [Leptotrombidium deliense]